MERRLALNCNILVCLMFLLKRHLGMLCLQDGVRAVGSKSIFQKTILQ